MAELRQIRARLLVDAEHYTELVCKELSRAGLAVWIATANLKDLRVEAPIGTRARAAGRYTSLLEQLSELAHRGVEVRILHGGAPSRAAREVLASLRSTGAALAVRQCPRVHLKMISIDGRALYLGSANFTGAGLGAKGEGRRNFELGVLTDDDVFLDRAQARFDSIWSGAECSGCRLRRECPAPLDVRGRSAPEGAPSGSVRTAARGRASSSRR